MNIAGWKNRIMLMLAVLGPGIITAVADNDAGGVATYSVAASLYGMSSQFLMPLSILLLALTQETGARITVATGKGLGDLIREKYGVRVALAVFIFYFFVNQGVVLQNMSGLKAVIRLFDLPWQISLVAACLFLILLVIKLNYHNLQKVFLWTLLFYGCYVVAAFMSRPDWGLALKQSFVLPENQYLFDFDFWFARLAVLGTTITAWGQFFLSSYIADKGTKPEQLKEQQVEVYFSSIITHFFSWMMAIAVTYALYVHGQQIIDGLSAASAMQPVAGAFAATLFGVGLFAASALGLTIVPLATAYVFTELFGYERTLNATFSKGRAFYSFFIIQILFGLIITLIPSLNLFNLTLYADYLNSMMLPVIFYFLIKFSEDKQLLGPLTLTGLKSWLLRIFFVAITIGVFITLFGKFFKL